MRSIFIVLLSIPLFVIAQDGNKGIKWINNLSWEQVKEKARIENKYILVDAFATWCKPCKKMDQEVFPVDSVGEFYNANFISVKFQMDETKNDNELVKAQREDVNFIKAKYEVEAYPSYLYFNPSGEMVAKVLGFQEATKFIMSGRQALTPGLVYHHPLERYRKLMGEYQRGIKRYDSMYYMWSVAKNIKPDSMQARLLLHDINEYLTSLPEKKLYSKDRIQFMESITTRPGSKWFHIFYKNAAKVNKVMGDEKYAERVVEKILLESVAFPYINWQQPRVGLITSKKGLVKEDLSEADWVGLEKKMQHDYNKYYAERVTLAARFIWYKYHQNYSSCIESYLNYLDRYGLNAHAWTSTSQINEIIWYYAYLPLNDKTILKRASDWMAKVVEMDPSFYKIDTYARLLYKSGNTASAIKSWKDAKLNLRTEPEYTEVLTKMDKGEKLDWWD